MIFKYFIILALLSLVLANRKDPTDACNLLSSAAPDECSDQTRIHAVYIPGRGLGRFQFLAQPDAKLVHHRDGTATLTGVIRKEATNDLLYTYIFLDTPQRQRKDLPTGNSTRFVTEKIKLTFQTGFTTAIWKVQ